MAPAYALGALAAGDRAAFEAHLVVCPACDEDARSLARVAAALACAAPPVDPEVNVRRRVAEAVERSGSSPDSRAFAGATGWARAPWLLAAASLALAAGLGAYALTATRVVPDAQAVVVVLAADDLIRVELAGQPVAPRASARAFWSRSRGLVFTASRLPELPAGRTYQLWIVTAQMPIGAGLLKPGADGAVQAVFATPRSLERAVAFAVTIEPEGGAPAPTGAKFLVGLIN